MTEADDALVQAIVAASRALVALTAASMDASPVEVTLGQFRVLVLLSGRGPQRMSGLGSEVGLSPSSITRMVERLERKGLVSRRRSPSSRRAIDIHLTNAGADLVANVIDVRQRAIRAIIDSLPEEDRRGMRRSFEEFARAAGEPVSDRVGGPAPSEAR